MQESLSDREHDVLEAVIRSYVDTAEPAGSRTVARRFKLGVSPATVRNTMSDLEEKGYLYHPHTSAGRVPTDLGYRFFVDAVIGRPRLAPTDRGQLRRELERGEASAVEELVRRAAQVLGLLTRELGVAIAPRLTSAVLERIEFLPLAEHKVLLVLALRAGLVRTVYVDLPLSIPPETLAAVGRILNERLSGLTLDEIRATIPARLRDSVSPDDAPAAELLNIFLDSADEWFDWSAPVENELHLGTASVLAGQPEFSSEDRLKALIELLERRELLRSALGTPTGLREARVIIGGEHGDPALRDLAVVTSDYRTGSLAGVIGVIGPTRMPYDRVIAFVESTAASISDILS
ncbi:MAG: heat-inducible transcriptional repressor HrcA [Longimicrobiaceae bacterium]